MGNIGNAIKEELSEEEKQRKKEYWKELIHKALSKK